MAEDEKDKPGTSDAPNAGDDIFASPVPLSPRLLLPPVPPSPRLTIVAIPIRYTASWLSLTTRVIWLRQHAAPMSPAIAA